MKYRLLLLEEGNQPQDLKSTVVFATDSLNTLEAFLVSGGTAASAQGTGAGLYVADTRHRGKSVAVTAVDPEVAPPGFQVGEVFPSAQALADAFKSRGGIEKNYNFVAIHLRSKKLNAPKDREAQVHGVTFAYVSDLELVED